MPKRIKKPKSGMRLFYLLRIEDVNGISGEGIVAEGVEFPNGQCVLHWVSQYSSLEVHPSMVQLVNIHGHEGKSVVRYY